MLFNSYEYILVFLPLTVLGFLLFGMVSRSWALGWLILASVVFYAWWRPFNVAIIGPSIAVNYVFARVLLRLAGDASRARARTAALTLGVLFNIAFLGYFKYANFAVTVAGDVTGTNFVLEQILLPLGISFITFQKIAFLIDIASQRIKSFTLRDFLLFVMFFPQLIAGPIVHYREMVPQFQHATCRFDATLYTVGLTLFVFGLFKKVVLADGMAGYVSPVYAFAAAGQDVTLLQGWLAAVGFTLQIYFDFSGYTDMACGAALFFGVRLPYNFDSPLKATNIIDFWLRWHVTLTRFLTSYVYTPIALTLTRRRAAKGLPMLGSRGSDPHAFFHVLVWPTAGTMLLSGLWHGAGYTFLVWGLVHGIYLVVDHTWRQYGPRPANPGGLTTATGTFLGFALTFLAVVFAMVVFRAPDLGSAVEVFRGMLGLNGVSLPRSVAEAVGIPALGTMALLDGAVDARDFALGAIFVVGLFLIAVLMPNSLQMLSQYDPVLDTPKRPPRLPGFGAAAYWRPTLPWLAFIAALAATSMVWLTGKSEFLYWQF